uniref:Uncharacterized protein n=1 Tax=Glossina palpalis gambiensis TaxID=67801 RepID=A0A1B0BID1_9MUSC
AKNRATITDLDNVILSTSQTLAKIRLLIPGTLNAKEIDLIPTNNWSTYLIRYANIKVITVNDVVSFLIKYSIHNLFYKKLIRLPVAHNGKMLHLEQTTVAKCNNRILALKNCSAIDMIDLVLSSATNIRKQGNLLDEF